MKRLTKLDTEEVSLVPRGANKRKFLIMKSGEKMSREEMLKAIQNCNPEIIGKVDKIIKDYNEGLVARVAGEHGDDISVDEQTPLDDRAAAAMKATARILTPFKGKIPAPMVHKMVDETLGGSDEGEDMGNKEASSRQSPEKVTEEHEVQAMKAATMAYGAELKKLGYQKYPTKQITQKDVEGIHGVVTDDENEEEEQEGTMHDPDVEKNKVMKSLEASISKLPSDQKKVLNPILKSLQHYAAENGTMRKELNDLRHRELRREFVTKADGFKALPGDKSELADTLMALSQAAPKEYEKIEKILLAADQLASKVDIFGEVGSKLSHPSVSLKGSDAEYEKIVQAAMGHVQKSGEKLSEAEAMDRFLDTPEGKRMYTAYAKIQMAQRS